MLLQIDPGIVDKRNFDFRSTGTLLSLEARTLQYFVFVSPIAFCRWPVFFPQVKWNRLSQFLLASAHEGEIKVWDARHNGSHCKTLISAHSSKINGLDWSAFNENALFSCSQDKTVKLFNVLEPRRCRATLDADVIIRRFQTILEPHFAVM